METKQPPVKIGYLNACIGGDTRYTDELRVTYDPATVSVTVTVTESVPVSGRDGTGGVSLLEPAFTETLVDPQPVDVLALVKRVIAMPRFTFKRHGKPSKEFTWLAEEGTGKGLSEKVVRAAMMLFRQ